MSGLPVTMAVTLFVIAVIVGAWCIQATFITIVWRANIDLWKQTPVAARWVLLGAMLLAFVLGMSLSSRLNL